MWHVNEVNVQGLNLPKSVHGLSGCFMLGWGKRNESGRKNSGQTSGRTRKRQQRDIENGKQRKRENENKRKRNWQRVKTRAKVVQKMRLLKKTGKWCLPLFMYFEKLVLSCLIKNWSRPSFVTRKRLKMQSKVGGSNCRNMNIYRCRCVYMYIWTYLKKGLDPETCNELD